ncbi:hypothetical protein NFI96_027204 [Prochilodus magdalenae]|nr:hypothetical protein NFI96_027204 [Prochilodus magdalenae]
MASEGVDYPMEVLMDSQTGNSPPLPPRPGQRRSRTIQTALFIMVSAALLAVAVEACFIYHLYKTKQSSELLLDRDFPQTYSRKDEQVMEDSTVPPKTRPPPFKKPTKPLAHLMAGSKLPGTDGVMPWTVNVELDLHQLEYTENKLVVQKEGYYYIYSKLTFNRDKDSFTHLVVMTAKRFTTQFPIELLRNRYHRNRPKPTQKGRSIESSYLGGVFRCFKGDAVFVLVTNGTVQLQTAADNYFGMFMV